MNKCYFCSMNLIANQKVVNFNANKKCIIRRKLWLTMVDTFDAQLIDLEILGF